MTTEQLHNLIRAVPFQPIVIHLADGRAVPVPHPEFIAHRPNSRIALVSLPNDSFEIIDLLLVVSLEGMPPASAPSTAGGPPG